MSTVQEHSDQAKQISTGLVLLKKRQAKLSVLGLFTASLFIVSFIAIFVQQDFIYSFFGLTQSVEQLHLPYTVDALLSEYSNQTDYFFNLLGWVAWFILKVFSSIIGAFISLHLLKKFKFFAIRFQSFILKFVAWLISIIVIWSGLTYVQYDLRDDDEQDQYELIHYQQHIQESNIAHILDENNTNQTVQAYVLGQVALLNKPIDKDVATSYIAQLAQAERTQNNFMEYGFKPEQIWSMQKQVYGQAMTPIAQGVEPKAQKAEKISTIVQMTLITLGVFLFIVTIIFYSISHRLKGRVIRIQQQLSS